ncbi:rhodanese-related sulfurtransferase [Bartonella sp. DGB1]|uniref:oxygen-dependent tRNA uridine(34) hydroxylase TrhO n=1 Tax=Bartonella sp. DGB1 TaxID=3239807 RepID=UPI00352312B6
MEKKYKIAALYCFADWKDFEKARSALLDFCKNNNLKGTLLIAKEGINGTVAGKHTAIDQLIEFIKSYKIFDNMELKFSYSDKMPFLRMKVKIKKEIVTLGVEGVNPLAAVGTYLEPQEWNDLLAKEDTVIIDTRNGYEYDIGTFKGAIDPATNTFKEFPAWVELNKAKLEGKKIAMFCTGGIRCEKATSYLKTIGYNNVYHLKGGILKYLETIPPQDSLWEGQCFVFDDRVSVGHGLKEGDYSLCRACQRPLSPSDKLHEHFEEGVSCADCYSVRTESDRSRFKERQRQIELAKIRGNGAHLGQA